MEVLALIAPSVNRVYGQVAKKMAIAEIQFILAGITKALEVQIAEREIGGIDYLSLKLDNNLRNAELNQIKYLLAYSPHIFAAFEVMDEALVKEPNSNASMPSEEEANHELSWLRPLWLPKVDKHPSDLLTTLKYQGKTNEQFTALMIHLAASAAGKYEKLISAQLKVLDPVAGRGTTLNQALMWGLSPSGVEIDKKAGETYRVFISTWLKEHRYKHALHFGKLSFQGKLLGHQVKAELKNQEQNLELFLADTLELNKFIKAGTQDVIVADLPYGVQHAARIRSNEQKATGKSAKAEAGKVLSRKALDLLADALPIWHKALVRDGAIALAINRYTAPWEQSVKLLEANSFRVVSTDGQFRHKVDASIDRDIMLAVKK